MKKAARQMGMTAIHDPWTGTFLTGSNFLNILKNRLSLA